MLNLPDKLERRRWSMQPELFSVPTWVFGWRCEQKVGRKKFSGVELRLHLHFCSDLFTSASVKRKSQYERKAGLTRQRMKVQRCSSIWAVILHHPGGCVCFEKWRYDIWTGCLQEKRFGCRNAFSEILHKKVCIGANKHQRSFGILVVTDIESNLLCSFQTQIFPPN